MSARGFSIVEVLVAGLIIGVAIVPLLQLLPGVLAPGAVSADELRLGAVGVRKAEEIIGRLRSNINSVSSGGETCTDLPNCWVQWTIATEQSSAVTGVGSLVRVAIVACQDTNVNSACDPAEPQVRFDTKVTSRP